MKRNTEKSKRVFQKIVIGLVVLATIFIFDFWLFSPRDLSQESPPPVSETETGQREEGLPDISDRIPPESNDEELPKPQSEKENSDLRQIKPSVNLSVPFAPQAPFADWDDLHNEACEEAALIMAEYWSRGEELTLEIMEKEILDSVGWQIDVWGGHFDLNVENMVNLGREYFGLGKIYFTAVRSIDDIKYELSKGNLVLLPAAGRLLENTHYRSPGPVYHALVVKGYDEKKIITNDPGTKRGQNFSYSYQNLFDSIHDWPFALGEKENLSKDEKATEILKGEKMMIVVENLR